MPPVVFHFISILRGWEQTRPGIASKFNLIGAILYQTYEIFCGKSHQSTHSIRLFDRTLFPMIGIYFFIIFLDCRES